MKNLVVLKFGGSSMGDSATVGTNLPKIAKIVKKYQAQYKNVIVVVSALAGETRRLKQIAELLKVNKTQKDEILAQGEIFSSHLLSTYLNQKGIKSVDLNGDYLPIHTSDNAGAADIRRVDTDLIHQNLQENVVIIPGFIGKNSQGRIATLGFDGSDTTAVTVAAAMKADCVCLFKDVNGVYSANPKRVAAQQYETLSLEDMWYFASAGAMIIHPKAIRTAIKNKFDIQILPNFSEGKGTLLTNRQPGKEVIGITYTEQSRGLVVSVVGNRIFDKKDSLYNQLKQQQIQLTEDADAKTKKSFGFLLGNPQDLEKCLKVTHQFLGLDNDGNIRKEKSRRLQLTFDPVMQNPRKKLR